MTSVADFNNNPGNLRPKGFTYKGQIGVDERGFAIFENKDAGRSALIQDIRAKQRQGLNNPNAFIDKYTPAMAENPEEGRDNYKIRMAQHLGLKSTTDPFPKGSEEKIADLIAAIEGGESPAPAGKEESGTKKPFEDYKPRVHTQGDIEPPPPLEKTGVEKAIDFATDVGGSVVNKVVENPELPAAAGLGLIKGTLEKVLQNPEKHLVGEGEKTPQQVQSARDAARAAQTRVGEVERIASSREPIDVDSLQREFEMRKMGKELMEDELREAQKNLKGLPKTYVPPEVPAASVATEAAENISAGRASGPKIEGDSGTRNWMIQEAGQKHQLPEAVLDMATGKSKDSPTGGKALIDQDLKNIQKINELGMGDTKLTTTPSGVQLQLPANVASDLEGELAAKQAQQIADQKALADQVEAKRLAAEADLARQRQMAEIRLEQARKSKISAGERAAEAKRKANAAQQRSAAQARSDAAKLETAQISARTAQQTAKEAAAAQPSGLTMATREAGRRFAEKAPIIGNVLGAAGATLSTDEAIDRYKKGDYSGAVLGTIEAALNAASMAPPTSPAGLMTKGVGTVGSLGMIPIWIAHDYFGNKGPWAPKKEPQKARGGLTLMR
jgi:hypothetical protein